MQRQRGREKKKKWENLCGCISLHGTSAGKQWLCCVSVRACLRCLQWTDLGPLNHSRNFV